MSKSIPSERVKFLRGELNRHSYLYYVQAKPEISDADFDLLYGELVSLEEQHPDLISADSPTQRIGATPVSSFEKVNHRVRMLSLDKVTDVPGLLKFFGNSPNWALLMEPKVDGLSLKLLYQNRQLVRAVTRGNGQTGDDVTLNARTIKTIPLSVPFKGELEVVGEVYMSRSAFDSLNSEIEAQGGELMANPRNAAAGSMKLKDSREVAQRNLSFVAYGVSNDVSGLLTQRGTLEWLGKLGFRTTINLSAFTTTLRETDITAAIKHGAETFRTLDVGTDGLVFKVDQLKLQKELGEGTKAPKWAVAYKFPPEEKVTELLGVTLQVGKSGKITPVAELKAVSLAGTEVKRASLCNQDEINRLGVNVGDHVIVMKANEIIPKIVGLAEKKVAGIYAMGFVCPSCHGALTRDAEQVDFYCRNKDCPEQVIANLVHATGKHALDMDGCGEALITELVKHGVRSLLGLYQLEAETLAKLLKKSACKRFLEGREKAKSAPFWRKLNAMGIDNCGLTYCQELAARWSSLSDIVNEADKLPALVGPVVTQNVLNYLTQNVDDIEALEALGFSFAEERARGPLAGKAFVITGNLMSGPRPKIMDAIQVAGGIVKTSVSRKVDFLVQGSEPGGNKLSAAAKHNVRIISEEELYKLMGQELPGMADDGDEDDDDET